MVRSNNVDGRALKTAIGLPAVERAALGIRARMACLRNILLLDGWMDYLCCELAICDVIVVVKLCDKFVCLFSSTANLARISGCTSY